MHQRPEHRRAREERRGGARGEWQLREQAERQERIRRAPLGPDEPAEPEESDGERAEPPAARVPLTRPREARGRQASGRSRRRGTSAPRQVERPPGVVRPRLPQPAQGQADDDRAEREIQEEHPAPAPAVDDDDAAEERPAMLATPTPPVMSACI